MAKKNKYADWSKEDLIKRVEALEKRKKYGLVWDEERTKEKFEADAEGKLPVLKEVKTKEIETDPDKPTHILIEGDNFHALSVLSYTHERAIDVIYIDPPYNTGARDWKYNNDYVDINDAYRHSKWLSFMEKRLKLAKQLLKQNGVLICTIDKNEQANLGVLLQEIFNNKEIVCVTIIHNPGGIQGKNFSHTNEFAYFIHPLDGTFISATKREDAPPTAFRDWGKQTSKREAAKTCFYPIYVKDGKIIGFGNVCPDDFHPAASNILKRDGVIEIYPIDQKGIERKWRFGRETVEEIRDELFCKKIKDEFCILREKKDYRWKTVWTDTKYNANVYGTKLLSNIIEAKFPYPKSLYAVMDCIKAVKHDSKNSTILDFFAGSGTTGHAVMELNELDNGNRKFILCTNNEDNNSEGTKIADDICYPRIEKVIRGYKGILDGKRYKGLTGNLKYYRTSFVPSQPTDKNKELLTKEAVEMLCLRENTFEFVSEAEEIKIYKNKNHYTGIIFDQLSIPKFKKMVSKFDKPLSVYVFSLGDDDFAEEFSDIKKIKVCSIPEAILRVYRRIFQ